MSAALPIVSDQVSQDRFHNGAFEVLQPVKGGHRAGHDALLLAAFLPGDISGALADLGAGAGVAGLAAANLFTGLTVCLIEADPHMADLARAGLELPANRRFAGRIDVLQADVMLTGREREEAGLISNHFDAVIANPPYKDETGRASPFLLRRNAHHMGADGLDGWVRTAAAILKPGGVFCMIHKTEALGSIIASFQGRFGGLQVLPLHAKSDSASGRMVLRAVKQSRAPLEILPGLVVHDKDGRPSADAAKILAGKTRIVRDS